MISNDDEVSLDFLERDEEKAFKEVQDDQRRRRQLVAVTNDGNLLGYIVTILFFLGMYVIFFDNSLIAKVLDILFK